MLCYLWMDGATGSSFIQVHTHYMGIATCTDQFLYVETQNALAR